MGPACHIRNTIDTTRNTINSRCSVKNTRKGAGSSVRNKDSGFLKNQHFELNQYIPPQYVLPAKIKLIIWEHLSDYIGIMP